MNTMLLLLFLIIFRHYSLASVGEYLLSHMSTHHFLPPSSQRSFITLFGYMVGTYAVMTMRGLFTAEPSEHYLAVLLCSPPVLLKLMMASFSVFALFLSLLASKSHNISTKGLFMIFSVCSGPSVPFLLPRASQESFFLHLEPTVLRPNALL